MPAITTIAINLLYFPCGLSDYLSHNLMLVQRQTFHLGFVRRSNISVAEGYYELKASWFANLTLVYQNFHTKP